MVRSLGSIPRGLSMLSCGSEKRVVRFDLLQRFVREENGQDLLDTRFSRPLWRRPVCSRSTPSGRPLV